MFRLEKNSHSTSVLARISTSSFIGKGFLRLNTQRYIQYKEISLPDNACNIEWVSDTIAVAYKREYALVNVESGSATPLFTIEKTSPLLSLVDNEYLFANSRAYFWSSKCHLANVYYRGWSVCWIQWYAHAGKFGVDKFSGSHWVLPALPHFSST